MHRCACKYAAYIHQRKIFEKYDIYIAVFNEGCDFFVVGMCTQIPVEDKSFPAIHSDMTRASADETVIEPRQSDAAPAYAQNVCVCFFECFCDTFI